MPGGFGTALSGIGDVFNSLPPTNAAKFAAPPAPWMASESSTIQPSIPFTGVKTSFFQPTTGGNFGGGGFFDGTSQGNNFGGGGFFAGANSRGGGSGFFNVPGSRAIGTYSDVTTTQDPQNMSANNAVGGSSFGGSSSSLGGDWSGVDQWTPQIEASAKKYGVDPNMIKALMKLESNGDPNAGGAPGVVGVMQVYTNVWGNGPWETDTAANIDKGTEILKSYLDGAGGDYYEALRGYHGYGSDGYTTDTQYADIVMKNYNQLNQGGGTASPVQTGTSSAIGNQVVQKALEYVGTPYVWGGIPGAGQDPRQTGWDCSGMTYWLDQTYGSGQLPMGSHYQMQYAQQTGKLFNDTSQLQPGDLVFWDTGNYEGGGHELNNAGHVGIYIGDGKMLHAANPSVGTIVSDFNEYLGMYTFLGAMHSDYSGGGSGVPGQQQANTGQPQQQVGGTSWMPTSWVAGTSNIGGGPTGGGGGWSNVSPSFTSYGQKTGWL